MTTSMPGRFEGAPRFGPWVLRERLLGALKRSKPSGLLLIAPAGYGKTCLAAQFASSSRFCNTLWVSGNGMSLSGEALLALLAERLRDSLQESGRLIYEQSAQDSRESSDSLTSIREALRRGLISAATCFVIDDVSLIDAGDDMRQLLQLLESESSEASLVLTARGTSDYMELPCLGFQTVGEDQLRMNLEESRRLIETFCGGSPGEHAIAQLYQESQGHAALLSVLAKHHALGADSTTAVIPDLRSLLVSLAVEQLDEHELEALYALALLGVMSKPNLTHLGPEYSAIDVNRVGRCIPLVEVEAPEDLGARLSAHSLAQDAFSSSMYRHIIKAPNEMRIRNRCLSILEARRDFGQFLHLLTTDNDPKRLQEWLEEHGATVIDAGFRRAVKAALEVIPSNMLLSKPRLLLLSAELDLEAVSRQECLVKAAAVRDLALCDGDYATYADALMLIARSHLDDSAPARAIEPLETLLALPENAVTTEQRLVSTAYLMTFCVVVHDWKRVESARDEVMRQLDGPSQSAELRVRLLSQIATTMCLIGDYVAALPLFREAYGCRSVSARLRAMVLGNYGSALTEAGRTDHAAEVLQEALAVSENCGLDLYHLFNGVNASIVDFTRTGHHLPLSVIEHSITQLEQAGDYMTEVALRLQLAVMLRTLGRLPEAVLQIERVLERPLTKETPHSEVCAEAELAASLLAMDDLSAAHERAARVRARCARDAAKIHSLRADLVLAEISRRQDRLDEAIARISEHEHYLESGSANWLVGMYMRAFPHLLGLIARALGVARMPVHMLNMLVGDHIEDSLSASRDILDDAEWHLLATRLLGEKESKTKIDALRAAPVCRVKMFGGLEVRIGDRRVAERDWGKRKARVLFASLVLGQGREVPREQLYEHLWPEMDDVRARNNFYVIWSAMKAVLTPGVGKKQPCAYVENTGGVCRSNPDLVRSDVEEFEGLIAQARKMEASGDVREALSAYDRLAQIYRGDLLPGDMYDDWFSDARDGYRSDFGDAMLRARALLLEQGDASAALRLVRRAIAADPWREDLYQAALRLQIATGQRSAAVETYLACRSKLVEDLGLDPCVDTVRLYEQVLAMEDGSVTDGFC